MNINKNDIYKNGVCAFLIQPGDQLIGLGLVLSILLLDKSVLLFVNGMNGVSLFHYPYNELFELQ